MPEPRKTALDALIKIKENGGYSGDIVNNILDESCLEGRDRAFCSAIIYGVIDRRYTLDGIIARFSSVKPGRLSKYTKEVLRIGVYQMVFMDKVPESAAVNESVKLIKTTKEAKLSGFVNGVLRSVARADRAEITSFADVTPDERRLSVKYSFPDETARLFIEYFGADTAERYFDVFNKRHSTVLRVNTLRTDRDSLMRLLSENGYEPKAHPLCETAVVLGEAGSVERLPGFGDGLFHVQDTACQLAAEALCVKPGMLVLDVCAAPGGKTFSVCEIMEGSGSVTALDVSEEKLSLIRSGAQRLGISNIITHVNDATKDDPKLGMYDRILCDVPCSGLGILGKNPEIRYKNVVKLDFLPRLQYFILRNAAKHLNIGGRLVYSTCTLNKNENSGVVERFLSEHPDFEPDETLTRIPRSDGEGSHMLTLFPGAYDTDGFFISAVKRVK